MQEEVKPKKIVIGLSLINQYSDFFIRFIRRNYEKHQICIIIDDFSNKFLQKRKAKKWILEELITNKIKNERFPSIPISKREVCKLESKEIIKKINFCKKEPTSLDVYIVDLVSIQKLYEKREII